MISYDICLHVHLPMKQNENALWWCFQALILRPLWDLAPDRCKAYSLGVVVTVPLKRMGLKNLTIFSTTKPMFLPNKSGYHRISLPLSFQVVFQLAMSWFFPSAELINEICARSVGFSTFVYYIIYTVFYAVLMQFILEIIHTHIYIYIYYYQWISIISFHYRIVCYFSDSPPVESPTFWHHRNAAARARRREPIGGRIVGSSGIIET